MHDHSWGWGMGGTWVSPLTIIIIIAVIILAVYLVRNNRRR